MIQANGNWFLNGAWKRLSSRINLIKDLILTCDDKYVDKALIIYFRGLVLINNNLYMKGFSLDYPELNINVLISNYIVDLDVNRWEECDFGEIRINSWIFLEKSMTNNIEKHKNYVYQHIYHRGNIIEKNIEIFHICFKRIYCKIQLIREVSNVF
jgi:hypothetical protein